MAAKKKSKQKRADAEDDADETPAKKGNMGLMIGLAAGGVLVLLLLCGGVSVVGYFLFGRSKNQEPVAGRNDGKKLQSNIKIIGPVAEANLASDPKWRADADLKTLLPGGRWFAIDGGGADCFEFSADGRVKTGILGARQGTYRFQGSDTLETAFNLVLDKNAKWRPPDEVDSYVCLANDDELALMQNTRFGSKLNPGEFILKGKYYRLRADGAGLGHAKVTRPVIEKLKSADVKERISACQRLKWYGNDSWPAVPELIRMVENDRGAAWDAIDALSYIGPKAKDAMPALRKQLNSGDPKIVQRAEIALAWIERDQWTNAFPGAASDSATKSSDPCKHAFNSPVPIGTCLSQGAPIPCR